MVVEIVADQGVKEMLALDLVEGTLDLLEVGVRLEEEVDFDSPHRRNPEAKQSKHFCNKDFSGSSS